MSIDDVIITVYRQKPKGSINHVSSLDKQGCGMSHAKTNHTS